MKHKVDPNHEANQIHKSYIASANARNLSVAYGHRSDWFRLDSRSRQKWVYPAPNECLSATDVDYLRGMSRFDWRTGKENWTTSNVFDRTLKTSAAIPFTHKLNATNWPPKTKALLNGENGGLDAEGSGLKKLHQQAFGAKLKPGIHFIRVANFDSGPVWVHVKADALLNWEFNLVKDIGVVITKALIENILGSNHLVRTIYEVKGQDVVWKSYISTKRVNNDYIIYAPRELKEIQFDWNPLEEEIEGGAMEKVEGSYKGLAAVPIAPFYTDWEVIMQSPPLFAEAADLQLRVDNATSHLFDYRLRASASPFVAVTGAESDDNDIITPVSKRGAMIELPEGGSADWKALDTSHATQEAERIAKDEDRIEFMCLSPLSTEYTGEKRVLETSVREGRSVTLLEALMLFDIPSLDRLARFTARLLGETVPNDAKITASRIKREGDKKDFIDKVQKWANEGDIPIEVFYILWRENSEDIPEDVWDEIQPMLDAKVQRDLEIENREKEIRDTSGVKVSAEMDLDAGE